MKDHKMLKHLIVNKSIKLIDALKMLDKSALRYLLVLDEDSILIGSLSDGDVRRAILSGADLNNDISNHYMQDPIYLEENSFVLHDAQELMSLNSLMYLPIADQSKKFLDIVMSSQAADKKTTFDLPKNCSAVIMAGGIGSRLEPFTSILPKPLVPVQGKPIIDHIIENFMAYGIKDFYISVKYKARIMRAYFEEMELDRNITFIEEDTPLGTAGGLSLLPKGAADPIFVTNCDVILSMNYQECYDFHLDGKFAMTIVAAVKKYRIPYGSCELDADGSLLKINEKPEYQHIVNTGFYVLDPSVLDLIEKGEHLDMDKFIQLIHSKGLKVGIFPISEDSWNDVGEWNEYHNTIQSLEL